jgi:integrase
MTTRRKRLTDLHVTALPIRAKSYFHVDPEMNGHYIRITPNGAKSFVATARDPYGKQVWSTLGGIELLKIDEARELARTAIRRIKEGLPAKATPPARPDSYASVAANWLTREVAKKKLITQPEIERVLKKYVLPTLGERPFTAIKRSHISVLLDKIEDKHGARQADVALAYMRCIADWYAKRDDDYASPFVKNMKRNEGKPRDRILDDNEIRIMWKQAGAAGTLGAFVKMLLLLGQRRETVRHMRWDDLSDSNVWTIPQAERGKGNAGALKLPGLAVDIIRAQPKIADNPFVFASAQTDGPVSIGNVQRQLRNPAIRGWRLHDLRRTSRSLLARAGINREIAERVLGHKLVGVEGIYNRFDYFEQKGHALAALANLIEGIIDGHPDKVVPIRQVAR